MSSFVDIGERLRQQETAELLTAAPTVNLSVASANAEGTSNYFARADHSHAITSSSAPGAAASILATDAAGSLTLAGVLTLSALGAGYVKSSAAGVLSVAAEVPLIDLGSYTQGDLIYGGGADWQDLAHPGAANRVLQSTAAEVGWSANAVTFPAAGASVVGSGVANRVAYWSGPNTITSDAGMTYNAGTDSLTAGNHYVPDGGTYGIIGAELLTFNAAGNATFSGVGSVIVPDGAWVGADAACSWAFDSSNGDVTTLDKVGIGIAVPRGALHIDDNYSWLGTGYFDALVYVDSNQAMTAPAAGYTPVVTINLDGTLTEPAAGSHIVIGEYLRFQPTYVGDAGFIRSVGLYVEMPAAYNYATDAAAVLTGAGSSITLIGQLATGYFDQANNAAAIPVLTLDQADISEGLINFIGSERGVINQTANSATSVRVEANGTVYRLALYVDF